MNEQLILIAGLPGSGKTTYLCRMLRDGWLVFDDYKAEALEDCSKFGSSRKLLPLISALRASLRCAVADIDFCRTESRHEAEDALREQVPGVSLCWHFFENDPLACEANIRRRNRDCLQRELGFLQELSPGYLIPDGAVVFAVRRNTDQRELRTENLS
jgi:hypothetical protein